MNHCAIYPLFAGICLLATSTLAATPRDGAYLIQGPGAYPHVIIEHGTLKHASGYLLNPVCTDQQIQSPALITELEALVAGYPASRVINQGDGHYLLTTQVQLNTDNQSHEAGTESMHAVYAELEFISPTQGTFTLRVATAFYTGVGQSISSCMAKQSYAMQRVNS